MLLKSSLIFTFALFAVSIRANGTPEDDVLQQALAQAYPDFPLALKASGVIYKAMAMDAMKGVEKNSIRPILKSILRTLNNPKGAETIKLILAKIKDILEDENAQQTLINISATLNASLTYNAGEDGVQFPWKKFKEMRSCNGQNIFPMIQERLRRMAHDPSMSAKYALVMNYGENTLVNLEQDVSYKKTVGSVSGNRMASRDIISLANGSLLDP